MNNFPVKTQDVTPVTVVFRKFYNGETIAIFPYEIVTNNGMVNSYQHVGQHGPASISIVNNTELAKENEYSLLKRELESIGYALEVKKKINYKKYLLAKKETFTKMCH